MNYPYFYIITEHSTGKHYAGVRYAENCNSNELLQYDGYITSSKIIHNIIKNNGIKSFYINRIKLFTSIEDAISYEYRFLNKVDAANNINFYNASNNANGFYLNVNQLKNYMLDLYGEDNCSKLEHIKIKKKNTCQKNHGYDYTFCSPELSNKVKSSLIQRYGVDNPAKSKIIYEKIKSTNLYRYGTECPLQNEDIKNKTKITNLKKYGTEFAASSDVIKEKIKNTNLNRYGTTYGLQNEDIKNKSKATCLEKYGVDNYAKTDECRHALSIGRMGINNPEFKGYYITPFGRFITKKEIIEACPTICGNFIRWCKSNTSIISNACYSRNTYLQNNYPKSIIGKTFEDLGFSFEYI